MLVKRSCPQPRRPGTGISIAHTAFGSSTYHLETLICKLSSLVAGGAVYPTTLLIVLCGLQDPRNGSLQLFVHHTVQDGMADVIAEIKWADEEDINTWDFGNRINLGRQSVSFDTRNSVRTGRPTFFKPSSVSICTIVNRLSLACCRYS